jgi:hypothetical protein
MGAIEAAARDLRPEVFPEPDEPWIHRSSQRTGVLKVLELQASQLCAIFGHLRTGRKWQVRAFQHVVNTPRETFPFCKLQLSPSSSHRDQSSTGGVHGPSLLASAVAKQRWRVTRCSSVSSTSLDRGSGTELAVTARERSSQLRDGTCEKSEVFRTLR